MAEDMVTPTENHFPWTGSNKIVDTMIKAKNKLDNRPMNLYQGEYTMASCCTLDVMIKKGANLKIQSYDLLRDFQHETAIMLLDFYPEKKNPNHGRLVIPQVQNAFKVWLEFRGRSRLFDQTGHMTPMFEKMIIDFCDLIEKLHKKDLVLVNFSMEEDMYVNDFDEMPKLCILLCEVRKVDSLGAVDKKRNWNYVKEFLGWCEEQCKAKRDSLTQSFCNFIGSSMATVERLTDYPHNWHHQKKGKYLMALVAANHTSMTNALRGLIWPYLKKPYILDNLPDLLCLMLEWVENATGRGYDRLNFFEYILLLRHGYKHYKKMTGQLKDVFVNQKAFIDIIEEWTPQFWTTVYETVGWPIH